jgi:glycosyltransferase involved in cell wall biosynthesis
MTKPLISVVLPVKNGGAHISRAVKSVMAQTFQDFELLVIDDGSTDATRGVVSGLQASDPRIRLLRNPGAGLVDALNYGVSVSSGVLIARLDADDVCLPERFQRQRDYLAAHPGVAVVGSQVSFIDEQGGLTGKTTALPESPGAIDRALLQYCCLRHPTIMMRRDAFLAVGGYRRQFPAAEDFDLWLRVAERFRLANLPEALLLYRLHPAQVSEQAAWTQRSSRNLALLSARERRQGREDPINTYACYSAGARAHVCRNKGCQTDLCQAVRALRLAELLICGPAPELSLEDARLTLRYLSRNTIGDGQSRRLLALVALCQAAIRLRAPMLSAAALGMALYIHPGRTVRLLASR